MLDEDNQALKRQRKNFESSKRKKTHHIQGHPGKVISRFLTRNPLDQKRVGFTLKELKTNQPTTEKQTANQECFPRSPLKFLFYVCHLFSSRAFCQVYWTLCYRLFITFQKRSDENSIGSWYSKTKTSLIFKNLMYLQLQNRKEIINSLPWWDTIDW